MKVPIFVILLTAGTLSVVAARRWHAYAPSVRAPSATGIKGNGRAAAVPPAQQVKVLSLKVTRRGFMPASITAPKGDYLLTVLNSTELDGLELRLDREGGPRAKEGKVSREKPRWNERVELHPGDYVLTEATHPDTATARSGGSSYPQAAPSNTTTARAWPLPT